MSKIYLVTWVGGYEMPAYSPPLDNDGARKQALEWANQMGRDSGDQVDVLLIDTERGTTERLWTYYWNEDDNTMTGVGDLDYGSPKPLRSV